MYTLTTFSPIYEPLLSATRSITAPDVAVALVVLVGLRMSFRAARRKLKTTSLRGPPRSSLIYGVSEDLFKSTDVGSMYEAWAKEYGVVYEVPTSLGTSKIVLCDPKAIAHYYARETWTYVLIESSRTFLAHNFGKGILWSQGEDHKRQRKSLTPAFSHAAIRKLTPIFFQSAYKAAANWQSIIDAGDGSSAIIEVQNWMNHIALDTIGLAGFSHDFGSLDGKPAPIAKVFDTFGGSKLSAVQTVVVLLQQVLPLLVYVPTRRAALFQEMKQTMSDISKALLDRTKKEKEEGVTDGNEEKSVIGLLVKAEDAATNLHLTHDEVLAQMRVLLLAGYETSSISLTWALLELAQNPDIQKKLRDEILAFGAEPTLDQLTNSLPYLDAVVHEALRVHPPITDFVRVACEDDVIPLSEPVCTSTGEVVDKVFIARGTRVGISPAAINRSAAVWGSDSKVFRPERWLDTDGVPKKAQEVQGHRHLLTFVDGPRTCLGKGFAVAEIKSVLFVLVKNFMFEMKDSDSKVEIGRGILPRPKVAGEDGTRMPLRVSRYEE